jgi:hypothetical protein
MAMMSLHICAKEVSLANEASLDVSICETISQGPEDHSCEADVKAILQEHVLVIFVANSSRFAQSESSLHEEDDDPSGHNPANICGLSCHIIFLLDPGEG